MVSPGSTALCDHRVSESCRNGRAGSVNSPQRSRDFADTAQANLRHPDIWSYSSRDVTSEEVVVAKDPTIAPGRLQPFALGFPEGA